MSFVFNRYAQALEASSYPIVYPSDVPAGPEAAPTFTQSTASPTPTTLASSSTGVLSTSTTIYLSTLLPVFTLLVLAFAIWKIRGWRKNSSASCELSVEKDDVEAQSPRPLVPVTPQTGVRWQPQIRSISGPAPKETERRVYSLPKRARSPPPTRTYNTKNQNPFVDSYPKSAPASALSFSEDALLPPPYKGWNSKREMMSPPVSPYALASGMQTRSMARPGQPSLQKV